MSSLPLASKLVKPVYIHPSSSDVVEPVSKPVASVILTPTFPYAGLSDRLFPAFPCFSTVFKSIAYSAFLYLPGLPFIPQLLKPGLEICITISNHGIGQFLKSLISNNFLKLFTTLAFLSLSSSFLKNINLRQL